MNKSTKTKPPKGLCNNKSKTNNQFVLLSNA